MSNVIIENILFETRRISVFIKYKGIMKKYENVKIME